MDARKKAREYLASQMDKHGGCQTTEAIVAIESAIIDYEEDVSRLRAKVERLDEGETQAIKQRDHAEKIIDKLCDTVLGTERSEWSSGYYFEDAVDDVETAIYRLRAEADAMRVDAERYRWLRDQHRSEGPSFHVREPSSEVVSRNLDHAIDAVMAAMKERAE